MVHHPYVQRVNSGGNYCGHNPESPRLCLTTPIKRALDPEFQSIRERSWANVGGNLPKGGLPIVITDLIERIPQYYGRPRKVLPSLDLAKNVTRQPELFSNRQQRSERREACIVVLAAILRFTDLATLLVGVPTAKGFVNLTFKQLAKHTHLGAKRFERAITDIKNAGIITIAQRSEKNNDGEWRGLAAIKAVNKKLFDAFGLGQKLDNERDKASKRLKLQKQQWEKEQQGKPSRAGIARTSMYLAGKLNDKPRNTPPKPPTASEQQRRADRRQKLVLNLQVKYRLDNPEWTPAQCKAAAEREADLQGV